MSHRCISSEEAKDLRGDGETHKEEKENIN